MVLAMSTYLATEVSVGCCSCRKTLLMNWPWSLPSPVSRGCSASLADGCDCSWLMGKVLFTACKSNFLCPRGTSVSLKSTFVNMLRASMESKPKSINAAIVTADSFLAVAHFSTYNMMVISSSESLIWPA